MADNKDKKVLTSSIEREESQVRLNSPESEKIKGSTNLNVPHLRFPEFSGEWEKCSIQDYGEVVTGNTPPTSHAEYYENGSYLWASPADLGINKNITETKTKLSLSGFKKTRSIPKGSILVTCIGSTIGKMGMAAETMSSNQQINSIVVNDKSNSDFVYYAICRAFPRYLSEVAVQAVPILSKSNFEKLPNYTTCRDEQDKIGYFLNLLDERIATQNKIIEKLESLIKGISQRLLSPKQGWTSYRFDELCLIKSGYSGTQVSFQTDYKVSRIETISKHSVDMSRTGFVKTIPQEHKLNVGDILFSNINSVQYIGNTAYIDKDYGLYHGMNLLRIIPNSQIVFPRFIHLLLCTDRLLRHFQSVCNKAVSQASINQTSLGKTIISIPSYEEQKHSCCVIESVERKLNIETNLLEMLQYQKHYLLRQMFI